MAQTTTIAQTAFSMHKGYQSLLSKIQNIFTTHLLTTGALAIHGSSSALFKTVNTIKFIIGGNLYTKAAADSAALAGTVTNGTFNVFCLFVDTAGTFTVVMGTAGATLKDVVFPAFDGTKALVGFIIVNPTGTGDFTGGTTALDDATVVPNVAYVDCVGPRDFVNMIAL